MSISEKKRHFSTYIDAKIISIKIFHPLSELTHAKR